MFIGFNVKMLKLPLSCNDYLLKIILHFTVMKYLLLLCLAPVHSENVNEMCSKLLTNIDGIYACSQQKQK